MKKKAISNQNKHFDLLPVRRGLVMLLFTLVFAQTQAAIIYVKHGAAGAGNGSSWSDAFPTLQEALDVAVANDEIWVAAGTYRPTAKYGGSSNHHKTFFVDKDIKIYGGFAGTESELASREWESNLTILSGDVGVENDSTDNSYHVLWFHHLPATARLDGFTITDGTARINEAPIKYGGGIYNDGSGMGNSSNPQIANCIFDHNVAVEGAAIYNNGQEGGGASPTISDCTFINNWGLAGGAIYNFGGGGGVSNPVISDCLFQDNYVQANAGAILNIAAEGGICSPEISRCTFDRNMALIIVNGAAGGTGGVVLNAGNPSSTCAPVFTDCEFTNNVGVHGGVVFNLLTCSPTFNQCTFTSNTAHYGGAIYALAEWGDSELTMTSCDFSYNAAFRGGAIGMEKDIPINGEPLDARVVVSLDQCVFFNNGAGVEGGAIYSDIRGGSENVVINGCTFDYNFAELNSGGAISNSLISVEQSTWEQTDCIFTNNTAKVGGGAMIQAFGSANSLGSFNPVFRNNVFSGNMAEEYGGAVVNGGIYDYFAPVYSDCRFEGNWSMVGGGMYNLTNTGQHEPKIINSTFIGNVADSLGGAIFNLAFEGICSPALINCSISGNDAVLGGGAMYNEQYDHPDAVAAPLLTNCIVWGNGSGIENLLATPTIDHSIVEGGCPTGATCSDLLDTDPQFVSQPPVGLGTSGDLHLQPCSPAIDAGTTIQSVLTDWEGDARPVGVDFDMGVDEYTGLPCGWTANSDGINCGGEVETAYDFDSDSFILSGEDCYDPNYYSNSDAQNIVQQELCGDGEIIAHVTDIDGDAWAGIFMRESNDPGAKMLQLALDNTGLAQRKLRTTTGGYAFNHLFQNQGKFWLRLTRSGSQFGAYLSLDGSNWNAVFLTNIPMTNCIQTGLFLSNATPGSTATAWFDNVQIKPPNGQLAMDNEQHPTSQYANTPKTQHANDQFPNDPASNNPMTNPQQPTSQYANTPTHQNPNIPLQRDINIYPNPTDGEVHVVLNDFMEQPLEIAVYNQQGQMVKRLELLDTHNQTERLKLYDLQDGLYLIQIRSKTHTISKKISLIR